MRRPDKSTRVDARGCVYGADRCSSIYAMSLSAYIGAAGVGKTVHLMRAQGNALAQIPLGDGQRVLALTFMHGSRRRVDDKLRGVAGLRGRYSCMTIDRFAWELCVR